MRSAGGREPLLLPVLGTGRCRQWLEPAGLQVQDGSQASRPAQHLIIAPNMFSKAD